MSDNSNNNTDTNRALSPNDANDRPNSVVFPPELLPSLARVVAKARDEYAPVIATPDWPPADCRSVALNVQAALRGLGYEVSLLEGYAVWELYSLNSQAGWLVGGETVDGALGAIANLCEDVARGWDYAGIVSSPVK